MLESSLYFENIDLKIIYYKIESVFGEIIWKK